MRASNVIKSALMILMAGMVSVLYVLTASGGTKSEDSTIRLPIIMYHSLLKDKCLQNDYVVSPDVFEQDLKYFKDNGYTTVTVEDLIDYVNSDKELSDKIVMLTFDDGYYNNYLYAYPLLEKYSSKAVISPIIKMTEQFTQTQEISASYGYLSLEQIKEMTSSGLVEIQNHSYDMHNLSPRKGIAKKKGESDSAYISTIKTDIEKAENYLREKANIDTKAFVYPFGEKNNTSHQMLKDMGFLCTMTCTEKLNHISENPDSLYELGRFRRDSRETTEQLMNRIYRDE